MQSHTRKHQSRLGSRGSGEGNVSRNPYYDFCGKEGIGEVDPEKSRALMPL